MRKIFFTDMLRLHLSYPTTLIFTPSSFGHFFFTSSLQTVKQISQRSEYVGKNIDDQESRDMQSSDTATYGGHILTEPYISFSKFSTDVCKVS